MNTDLKKLKKTALSCSKAVKLPLHSMTWKGQVGESKGNSTGSSLDFQDHRYYNPGDDPRHINWQAYARTGDYSLKLYREEVRPIIDIVLDLSSSMFISEKKSNRSIELFYLFNYLARQEGALTRLFCIDGTTFTSIPMELIQNDSWLEHARKKLEKTKQEEPPHFQKIPFQMNSLKIIISDLLFDSDPKTICKYLSKSQGRNLIFSPFCYSESQPEWLGNYEFIDTESKQRQPITVHNKSLGEYLSAYKNHFGLWKQESLRNGIILSKIPSSDSLLQSLKIEPLQNHSILFT